MATIADLLKQNSDKLTKTERQLSSTLLKNYPVSAIGNIVTLADSAGVSTPSVLRLVKKLGFKGFPQFQESLRAELQATTLNPIAKRNTWAEQAPNEHILNTFANAATSNIRQSLAQIDSQTFDKCCTLLADMNRQIFISGGRITGALADYFFMHMKVMRKDVFHVKGTSSVWPHDLLDVKADDIFVLFDVRRYENNSLKLAEIAQEKGAKIILFTDQWRSPIDKIADYSFSNEIVVPSAWDSMVSTLLLLETFIASVQSLIWPDVKTRMEELEETFSRTGLFRKF